MIYTIAIDISTFIWCNKDYENNKKHYYKLLAVAPMVYNQVKKFNLPILLRNELLESILIDFPYNMIREISYDFEIMTLNFLTTIKWFPYSENDDNSFVSLPKLVKEHFNDSIKTETQSQVAHLFQNGNNPQHKFLTYEYFFDSNSNLVIINAQSQQVEVDTLCFSTEEQIVAYFEKIRRKFEHNPKHAMYKSGGRVSPLSCYNERLGDKAKAQELLDKSIFHEGHYYNYDKENEVFVRFIRTSDLIYHGHDLLEGDDLIPCEVKKKICK